MSNCKKLPYFEGLTDETIKQGSDFDPTEGVKAYDGYDEEIEYTYSPQELDTCLVGSQVIQYRASQTSEGDMLPNICIPDGLALALPSICDDYESTTAERIIRIIKVNDPTIYGIPQVTVASGTAFNVLDGVTAVDDNGNPITDITYSGTLDKRVSGDIISIDDGDERYPVKSLEVELEPIQSGTGTPSPDNVRPINGHTEVNTQRTGINVWDEEWEVGYYSAAGAFVSNNTQLCTKNKIKVLPNTEYYFKEGSRSAGTNVGGAICFYDADENIIRRASQKLGAFTTPSNCHYINVNFGQVYGATYNHDISINYPSTDTDYHAYEGDTYTTSLGQTVYGGTLDVVSGELVVDRAMVDLGSLSWGISDGMYEGVIADRSNGEAICSNYPFYGTAHYTDIKNNMPDKQFGFTSTSARQYIEVRDSSYLTASDFKTAMQGVQLVYELATPQTYQLTPQTISLLHGNNNVWSDGEVEMVYSVELPTDGEVSYPLEGEYEITYSATDKCGNIGEAIRHITVQ